MVRHINRISNPIINNRTKWAITPLRTQTKRVNVGNRVAVGIGVAVKGYGIGNFTGDYIGIDKSSEFRTVITRTHIDKPVAVCHNAVTAVIEEYYNRCTRS